MTQKRTSKRRKRAAAVAPASRRIAAIQKILFPDAPKEWDGAWGKRSQAALNALLQISEGKGSWFSQYVGRYVWIDNGDEPNSNALGVPDNQQGIALPSRDTLGKWFMVTTPNSVTLRLRQTDLGPSKSTGRRIDIAAVAAEAFGYSPSNFPTDGTFKWTPA